MFVEKPTGVMKQYLDQMGLSNWKYFDVPDELYERNLVEARRQHPEENSEQQSARAFARAAFSIYGVVPSQSTPTTRVKEFSQVIPIQQVKSEFWLWAWRIAVLLSLLIIAALSAVAQTPGIEVIQVRNEGSIVRTWGGGVVRFDCTGLGIDCTYAAGVLTLNVPGGGGASHNVLSATHTDTTAGTVLRGDLITGQGVTPTWQRLAKGPADNCLKMDGTATDIIWGTCAAGGGITSLNGLTASSQTFADVDDTNVTLAISSVTSTHTFTMGWAGTLAKARQNAATVYTDQSNIFGAFLQAFQSGANFELRDPTDTTKRTQFDLSNIATATTRTVNVPDANSTTAQALTAPANQFFTAMSAQGVFSSAQPTFSGISGTVSDAQLANNYSGVGSCTNQFARTLNDNAAPTCASVGAADITDGVITPAKLTAAAREDIDSINVLSPTTSLTNLPQHKYAHPITILRVSCSIDSGTSVTIQLDERAEATPNTAGTNVMTASLVCDTNTEATTSFTNATIAADAPLNLQITAVSGTVNGLRVHIDFSRD